MGLKPFVAPGSYGAQIDLGTSTGPQSISATFVVLSRLAVGLAPSSSVFTGIAASTAVNGTVLVRNKGNVAVTVGAIPDAALFEVTVARASWESTAAEPCRRAGGRTRPAAVDDLHELNPDHPCRGMGRCHLPVHDTCGIGARPPCPRAPANCH